MKKNNYYSITAGILLYFFFLCSSTSANNQSWFQKSTPGEQGIDPEAILTFIEKAEAEIDAMHSFMILRHGKLVSQGWWEPFDPETPHVLHSLSKSFTSTAIGIAAKEGLLSLDDRVISFFPKEAPEDPSDNMKAMRIRDLITMNTGHVDKPWPEDKDKNWVKNFFEAEVDLKPGTHFRYNSMATYMLSAIIQKVSGEKLIVYLNKRLFIPLEIEYPYWETCPEGRNVAGWGLYVTTEDIAKLGQLYLQKGHWEGKQILSEEWVEMATSKQTSTGSNPHSDWDQGYGFQFWRCRNNCYRGDGAFGQFCLVLPEQDAVIAITSGTYDMGGILQLVWDILLPAMHEKPLPPNPEALNVLKKKTASLQIKLPQGNESSELMQKLSGSGFAIDENDVGLKSVSFDFNNDQHKIHIEMDQGAAIIPAGTDKYLDKKPINPLPYTDIVPGPVASAGAWIEPDKYRIRIYFTESTARLIYTFHFKDDELIWESDLKFALFGENEKKLFRGKKKI